MTDVAGALIKVMSKHGVKPNLEMMNDLMDAVGDLIIAERLRCAGVALDAATEVSGKRAAKHICDAVLRIDPAPKP